MKHELRIGNWVQVGEEETMIIQVESIGRDSINRTERWLDADEPGSGSPDIREYEYGRLTPIELTPELLEKCGFRNVRRGLWENTEAFEVEFDKAGSSLYFCIEGQWVDDGMKYLHQLQNLHFAITGKELEFKHD